MRLGRRLSSGIAEDPPRVEAREAPVVETPQEHEEAPQPVAAAAER